MLSVIFVFRIASIASLLFTSGDGSSSFTGDEAAAGGSVLGKEDTSFASSFIPTLIDGNGNISRQCVEDSRYYYNSLIDQQAYWALEMYEASAKIDTKVFYQNLVSSNRTGSTYIETGLFDQCLSISAEGSRQFDGKYCTVFFNMEPVSADERDQTGHLTRPKTKSGQRYLNNYAFVRQTGFVSFCIPSTCSAQDLGTALAHLVGRRVFGTEKSHSVVTTAEENQCHTRGMDSGHRSSFDGPAIFMMALLGFIVVSVVLATVHESWRLMINSPVGSAEERGLVRTLHCFSLIANTRALVSTTDSSHLACLNGIRVLSTIWVVFIHTCQESFFRHIHNNRLPPELAARWANQIFANGSVAVDTFFLMSGLLAAISLLREWDANNGRFNRSDLTHFYLHRYIRLTPLYAIILGVVATLLVWLNNGPDWNYVHQMGEDCRSYWWAHLLYIHNYVAPPPTFCMTESWSLAVDMQMFWLSPLIVYPLWRWRRAGVAWALFNIATFTGAIAAVNGLLNVPPTAFFSRPMDLSKYFRILYMQPYSRFPDYVVGILLGWVLHRTGKTTISFKKSTVGLSWTLSTLTGLVVIFGMAPFLRESTVPVISPVVTVIYGSLHRLAWVVAVSWLIFACVHGYGGFVERFLSSKAFLPLSRLTYSVYLIHFNYVKMTFSHYRKPFYFTYFDGFNQSAGVIFLTFILAAVVHVTVEMPFHNLEKIVLPKRDTPSSQVQTGSSKAKTS